MDNDFEKYKTMLSGMLDGELSPEEASELNNALIKSEKLRHEYEKLCATDISLQKLSMLEPEDEIRKKTLEKPISLHGS